MALKEKLELLQRRHESEAEAAKQSLPDWQNAVSALLTRIESDLAEYVGAGLMRVRRESVFRHEELLGSYVVDELRIDTVGGSVTISPVARDIIGGDGRVDLYRPGFRDAVYLLIWNRDLPPDLQWEIGDAEDRATLQPLTRDRLESAIERLLG